MQNLGLQSFLSSTDQVKQNKNMCVSGYMKFKNRDGR